MKQIDMTTLEEKMKNKENVNVIDVREDDEVAQGKIPGAKHIPLNDIPDRLNELDENSHYYMVCRSGGRSGKASDYLESEGYDVTNVDGGMLAWNGEVEK
ncbi:rhodanese-like domain-containing protein [Barrientosiimonas marina]|uniref:Rhodanese-like domain-containing protein n=1 Tax=Lentibacillus kimchii TaxID=1542911 RepID=A0ABW2UQM6_9BACI